MPKPPPILLADAPALDFLNSIATPVDVPVEWLDDGEGLLRWLEAADLVPKRVIREMRSRFSPAELDQAAAEARVLREWFRDFVQEHRGRPLRPGILEALEPLNSLLECDQPVTRIVAQTGSEGGGFELEVTRRWLTPQALLLPIAYALARLVCSEDFTDIKACEGSACTLLFADHTRSRARRWCSMALCGNRAKQAAHRRRLKAQH
jgi:predicted RNA-binding Zn ribbon-like protein